MLRFNLYPRVSWAKQVDISIHLMLRFNKFVFIADSDCSSISIHLMLRFNIPFKKMEGFFYGISIHLMLRFNNYKMLVLFGRQRFQYILCYGSTLILLECKISIGNFNTSYVTVQRKSKNQLLIFRKISIHLMLRFNILDPEVISGVSRFQYILCYGSTILSFLTFLLGIYFNTSYVTVQLA